MAKPTPTQTWVALLIAALTFATSYLGYDKYEQHQAAKNSNVNVTVAAPDHTHGPVVSRSDIERMIEKALKAQHEKNLTLFKKKEAWD